MRAASPHCHLAPKGLVSATGAGESGTMDVGTMPHRRDRSVRLLLAAFLALVVVLVPSAAASNPVSSHAPSGHRAAAARLRQQHPCPSLRGFSCATLRVPLDHSDRVGGRLELRVAAADNVDAKRGVLVLLTGGPGQPGVPYLARLATALAPVLDEYRLVMLDQRGTGASALRCPRLQRQVGSSDLLVPTAEAVERCASIVGGASRFYGTTDTVQDLDELRAALGAPRWTVDGVSYGTYVAERYALRYPRRVARLVLDSVVPQTGVGPFVTVPMHAAARVLRAVCAARRCPGDPAKDLAAALGAGADGPDLLNALIIEEFVNADYRGIPESLH
ncbi:MAG: alpha/beta fold hydrolase, partial [Sciscionella sp.]